jgi:ferredoxin
LSSLDSLPAAHTVRIAGTSASFPCREDVPVLVAMRALGRSHIPVGCRGGGCGVCKIEVVSGTYVTGKMSRAQVSPEEEARGIVLACQIRPRSDLVVRPID